MRFFSVTRGAEGASLYTRDSRFDCAGFSVNARDTTAAGDAYAAAIVSSASPW
ncbi:MAG: PfkB family carbohydrate kinase [Caldilinea sp.]